MKKFPIIICILSLLFGCTFSTKAPSNSGKISSTTDLFYDFGNMDINGGYQSHTFSFANDGLTPLYISDLKTSCMCTKAEIKNNSMETIQTSNAKFEPGELFYVFVTYDPLAHGPNAVGDVNRSIILSTTSEENGRTAVKFDDSDLTFTQMNIKGNVMYTEDYNNSK